MIIISDCIRKKADEGFIKVASSLAEKLKSQGHYVISTTDSTDFTDAVVDCNRWFSNISLYKEIKKASGNILYIPFASNTPGSAVRTLFLTVFSRRKVSVLFALQRRMNFLTKALLGLSKCRVISLSGEACRYFSQALPNVCRSIRTGVDCETFVPADQALKNRLRERYGIPQDKTVILHVGHLKYGRNIDAFLSVPDDYFTFLVFSSVTEKEMPLKEKLSKKKNIHIFEEYLPNIEELYQLSDVYVFPVTDTGNSIDIPLSVLEAAGCNIRIVSTPYKEIKSFENKPGLILKDYSSDFWDAVSEVMKADDVRTREIALEYSWNNSASEIVRIAEAAEDTLR